MPPPEGRELGPNDFWLESQGCSMNDLCKQMLLVMAFGGVLIGVAIAIFAWLVRAYPQ